MLLNDGTTTITIDDDLEWVDEFSFIPVTQDVQRTIGGNQVIQEAALVKGRPITLSGGESVWMPKKVLKDLQTMMSQVGVVMTLTMPNSDTYKVIFRHGEGDVISGKPVHRQTVTSDDTMYHNVTLKLMEIA